MTNKNSLAACAAALALFSQAAQAQPFGSFDPVSMAMGGAGVALPNPTTANLYNPAHLSSFAASRSEDFAVSLAAGARAYDEDDVLDVLDDASDNFDQIDQLATQIENEAAAGNQPSSQDFQALATALRDLDANLTMASGKHAQAEFGGNLLINGNTGGWGIGLVTNAHAAIGARLIYTSNDSTYLQTIATQAEAEDPTLDYDEANLTSEAQAIGAVIGEVGLTVAKKVDIGGQSFSIGVTPKYMQIETINYSVSVQNADTGEFDSDQYTKSYDDFNVDVGLLKDFGNGFYAGLTVKNLIAREYETAADPTGRVYTVKIDPQARAGVGYDGGWYRLALDADLTKNDAVAFEDGTQFVAAGVELDAFGWAQLRFGYRHNTVDSDRSVASAGLGLSPFKVLHLDLAVTGSDNEVGGAAQLALTF